MTPLFCCIVRALGGPAIVHDPLSCSLCYEQLWTSVSSRPPFSAFRRHSYTRFSNSPRTKTGVVFFPAHETKPAWYSSLGSSPIGALLKCRRCFLEDAILCSFSVVTRCSRVAQALSAWSWVFMCSRVCYFVFRILASYSSGPTPALQSLTLPTRR